MSKLCNIAIKENDGSIECINLYAVATVNREGLLLYQYYQDQNKIQSLIDLGDLIDLCQTVKNDPFTMHDVVNRQKNVCVFFDSDAGEIGPKKRVYSSNEEFHNELKKKDFDICFFYDKTIKQWFFAKDFNTDKKFVFFSSLKNELDKNNLIEYTEPELDKIIRNEINFHEKYSGDTHHEAYESFEDAYYDYKRLYTNADNIKTEIECLALYQYEIARDYRLDNPEAIKLYDMAGDLIKRFNKYMFDNFIDVAKEKSNNDIEM